MRRLKPCVSPVIIPALNLPSAAGGCEAGGAEDSSEFWVSDLGSSAWVGLVLRLWLASTDTGPEMSLLAMFSRDGGRLLLRHRSTLMNPRPEESGLVFLIQTLRSPLM